MSSTCNTSIYPCALILELRLGSKTRRAACGLYCTSQGRCVVGSLDFVSAGTIAAGVFILAPKQREWVGLIAETYRSVDTIMKPSKC